MPVRPSEELIVAIRTHRPGEKVTLAYTRGVGRGRAVVTLGESRGLAVKRAMFDVGAPELLVLMVIAVILFGPEKLPEFARKAARLVRYVRNPWPATPRNS